MLFPSRRVHSRHQTVQPLCNALRWTKYTLNACCYAYNVLDPEYLRLVRAESRMLIEPVLDICCSQHALMVKERRTMDGQSKNLKEAEWADKPMTYDVEGSTVKREPPHRADEPKGEASKPQRSDWQYDVEGSTASKSQLIELDHDVEEGTVRREPRCSHDVEEATVRREPRRTHDVEEATVRREPRRSHDVEEATVRREPRRSHDVEEATVRREPRRSHDVEEATVRREPSRSHDVEEATVRREPRRSHDVKDGTVER
jgi:hypothetical protein